MTGRYPLRYGLQTMVVVDFKPYGLALEEVMMSNVFKAAGYATHAVGKWHLGYHEWAYTPTFRGFDSFWGISAGEGDHFDFTWHKGFTGLPPIGDLHRASQPNCGADCLEVLAKGGENKKYLGYSTLNFTQEAVKVIDAHDTTIPLFMYIAYTAPHSPCQTPPGNHGGDHSDIDDKQRRVYAEMVSAVDEGVGDIMAALQNRDMLDNTILLFTSDNGAPIANPSGVPKVGAEICEPYGHWGQDTGGTNYPLRGGKMASYEGGVKGFSFVHWPAGIGGGRRYSGLMHITDWLPTLASAAGVSVDMIEKPLDGSDHWQALLGEGATPEKDLLLWYDCVHSNQGGCVLRGSKKMCIGGPFDAYYQIQTSPEMGAKLGLDASEGQEILPAWDCPLGCVVDLNEDPQERNPQPLTTDEHHSLKASYEQLIADKQPPLWDQFDMDRRAMRHFSMYKHTWPWVEGPPASGASLMSVDEPTLVAMETAMKNAPTLSWDA